MTEILITSSVLILALLVMRRLFRNSLSRRMQYALWSLVLLRLLAPVSLPAVDFSVLTATKPVEQTVAQRVTARPIYIPVDRAPLTEHPSAPDTAPENTETPVGESVWVVRSGQTAVQYRRLSVQAVLSGVWLAGSAVSAAWLLAVNLRFWLRLRRDRISWDVEGCALPVYLVETELSSPCLFGLFRPAIYLPPAALASPERLRYVLAHETTHARHLDHLWTLLRGVCLAVYWFDPLVWVASAAVKTDCELACDEGALARLEEEDRIPYGQTLLSLIPVQRTASPMLAATTMAAGKKQLKDRITRIAQRRRQFVAAAVATALLAGVVSACTFTGAVPPDESDSQLDDSPRVLTGEEPELVIPLDGLEPYEPWLSMEPDTVSADTMGELLCDQTLPDGTEIVCYWAPDHLTNPEHELTKYWAIRQGDSLLRFWKEEAGYPIGYTAGSFDHILGHKGFWIECSWGAAFFARDYYIFDETGVPRLLADCANDVTEFDLDGDGEDELLCWDYDGGGGAYVYLLRSDGTLCRAEISSLVLDSDALNTWSNCILDRGFKCLIVFGFDEMGQKIPRWLYFDGERLLLYNFATTT